MHPFTTDAGDCSTKCFVRRLWLVWDQGLTDSLRRISVIRSIVVHLRPRILVGTPATRTSVYDFLNVSCLGRRSLGSLSRGFQGELSTRILKQSPAVYTLYKLSSRIHMAWSGLTNFSWWAGASYRSTYYHTQNY